MEKLMPLDLLSSIKNAKSSVAVEKLFEVVRKTVTGDEAENLNDSPLHSVTLNELRSDSVQNSTGAQKDLIRKNFPAEKKGYLMVPKVIED